MWRPDWGPNDVDRPVWGPNDGDSIRRIEEAIAKAKAEAIAATATFASIVEPGYQCSTLGKAPPRVADNKAGKGYEPQKTCQ